MTNRFIVGWNMPGYMPDTDPEEYDNWDDARAALVSLLKLDREELEEAVYMDSEYDSTIRFLEGHGPSILKKEYTRGSYDGFASWSFTIGNRAYFIHYEGREDGI